VYVGNIPDEEVYENDIVEHFAQYGKVVSVVFSRKFGKMLGDYKKQDELNKKIYKQEVKVRILAEEQGKDPDRAAATNRILVDLK